MKALAIIAGITALLPTAFAHCKLIYHFLTWRSLMIKDSFDKLYINDNLTEEFEYIR